MQVQAAERLVAGKHFRHLSVADGGEMAFELLSRPAYFNFSEPIMSASERLRFFCRGSDGIEREWFVLESRQAIIMPWYRWNGNSPKKIVLGRRVGTLDFAGGWMGSTIECSLFHDPLFQFSALPELRDLFSLEIANFAYRDIGLQMKFRLISVYFLALKHGSHSSWAIPNSDIRCEYSSL